MDGWLNDLFDQARKTFQYEQDLGEKGVFSWLKIGCFWFKPYTCNGQTVFFKLKLLGDETFYE